jgi:hypothetical protein
MDTAQLQDHIEVGSRDSEFATDPLLGAESGHVSDHPLCASLLTSVARILPRVTRAKICAFAPILSCSQPMAAQYKKP